MSLLQMKIKPRRIIIWIVSILIIVGLGFWRVSEPEVPKSIEFDDIPNIHQGNEHRVGLSLPISVDDYKYYSKNVHK